MPKREASFSVAAPPEAVWRFVRDFEALCGCIPGIERLEVVDDRTARLTVQEKVGVVPLIVELTARIESESPPRQLQALATAEHLTMRIAVSLAGDGARTTMTTRFDVRGEGPLRPVVDRLFERRATERTEQFAKSLEARFGHGVGTAAASPEAAAAQPTGLMTRMWRWLATLAHRIFSPPPR
jgi:carbon monoxide dehydrogenase subunit G